MYPCLHPPAHCQYTRPGVSGRNNADIQYSATGLSSFFPDRIRFLAPSCFPAPVPTTMTSPTGCPYQYRPMHRAIRLHPISRRHVWSVSRGSICAWVKALPGLSTVGRPNYAQTLKPLHTHSISHSREVLSSFQHFPSGCLLR